MINKIIAFFRKRDQEEKIRIRIRGNRIVYIYYPASYTCDFGKMVILTQQIECYKIKLNGGPLWTVGLGLYEV